ncbi:MAG TPA: hypothetical protein VJ011_11305 [Steroidobacteraceae bacterium]|nr:hypothetical protein [Steroidobacteraceae bacterium]
MSSLIARCAITVAALSVCAAHAGSDELSRQSLPDYRVLNLSSLGGTVSSANSINDDGLVAGFSNLAGDNNRHAMLWLYGFPFELGTLGGPNSNVPWPQKNTIGLIAGIAQTATPEPNQETWSCRSFFATPTRSGFTCLGVVWENGRIRELPTLGGNNGFATGTNNQRQIVGWAENTVQDPTCVRPQVLQFRAVLWGPGENQKQELPPLPLHSVSAATAINDKGQVVGISGICNTAVGSASARSAVLWENGKPQDIGNLGGIAWNTPMAINQRGDIVGFSNISADDGNNFNAHAFVKLQGRPIQDLGVLEGDSLSQGLGINEKRQVVGLSCTAGFGSCRAFVWQNGVMIDLNEHRQPGYTDHLYTANDINERGEIAGQAVTPGTENYSAFWAVPVPRQHGDDDDASAATARARVELLKERIGLTD